MKKFKLKFNKFYFLAALGGILLCIAGFALNLWRCLKNDGFSDFYTSLQYIIIFAVTVFAPVLLISVLFFSKYEITDKEFITRFGFVKSKFPIADMTSIVYNEEKCSLTIHTAESFMVFRLEREWQKEFIDELKARNKNLLYNETDTAAGTPKNKGNDKGKGKNK